MKKKRKINKILIGVVSILLVVLLVIVLKSVISFGGKPYIEKQLNKVNSLAINGATKEELSKYFNTDNLDSNSLMTGPDSYMRVKPEEKIITKYKLDKYVSLQDKLATNVETRIKKEFNFIMGDEPFKDNGATVYQGLVKGFYQMEYLIDLKELQSILASEYQEEAPEEVLQYKAKVIAMKILDDYLTNYDNDDDYAAANIYIYEDKEKTDLSYISYLNMLQGVNYQNEVIDKLELTRTARLNKYIKEAIKKNKINGLNI